MTAKPVQIARSVDGPAEGSASSFPGFAEVYRRELPRLRSFFRSKIRTRDDAMDMTQEAMTRFIGATGATTVASPGRYLTRIATNMVIDQRKSAAARFEESRLPIEEAFEIASDEDLHRNVEIRLEAERWRMILSQLPPLALDVFLLNRIEGHTYVEVASILNITVWRVQKQMLKALRHIEAHLDREDG